MNSILALWRIDGIPWVDSIDKLFDRLHDPKILAFASIVDAVELHTSQDPIKLLDEWKYGKSKISSLLLEHNRIKPRYSVIPFDIQRLDVDSTLTIALIPQDENGNDVYISALTRLFKPLTGGLDRDFKHKVLKQLKRRTGTGFALSSLAGDIEALDELEKSDIEEGEKSASGSKTKEKKEAADKDSEKFKEIKKYISEREFDYVTNQFQKETTHFKKATGSLVNAISKTRKNGTPFKNYLLGVTVYCGDEYVWVQLLKKERGSYWYLRSEKKRKTE